jgi:hypothetical protein
MARISARLNQASKCLISHATFIPDVPGVVPCSDTVCAQLRKLRVGVHICLNLQVIQQV